METNAASIGEPLPLRPGERGTPLSAVDVAWLHMDEPANLMHIHSLFVVEGSPSRDEIAQLLERRVLGLPRLHQRIARDDDGRYVWVDDAAFDLAHHLTEEALPAPGGTTELAAKIAENLHRPLDRAHPLWEFRLFRGFGDGDTAVFGRLHHTIGDGVAMMVLLLALTDLTRFGPATIEPQGADEAPHVNPFLDLLRLPAHELEAAKEAAKRWLPETFRLMQAPVEAFRRLNPIAKGLGSTAALTRLVGRWNDPKTVFKGKLSIEKRVAWTDRIPLETVKTAGRALGVTMNDLLNAAMAGGLHRYLARRATPPARLAIRCAMPINLRPIEEMGDLGNRFGLVFLSLPIGTQDPLARLESVRQRADALKRSAEPLVVFRLLDLMGRVPLAVHRLVVSVFQAKATAVFTNVPGPRQRIWLAGYPLKDIFFWVPQAGRLGLGVSIFSYDGGVRMGVGTDAGLVPDPERIVEGFYAELDALLAAAGRSRD